MGTALLLTVVLLATAPDGGPEPVRVRVLFAAKPAPPATEVRMLVQHKFGHARWGAPTRFPDAEGWVEFEPSPSAGDNPFGPGTLEAEHPALGRITGPVGVHTLTFPEGEPLEGRVLDDQGRPAAGATVLVIPQEPASFGWRVDDVGSGVTARAVRSRAADASGHFEFLGLPPGRYAVVAHGDTSKVGPAVEAKAGRRDVLVRLAPRFVVLGRLVDHAGQPIAQARIAAGLAPGAVVAADPMDGAVAAYRFEQLFEPPPMINPAFYFSAADTDDAGLFRLPVEVAGPVALVVHGKCFNLDGGVASGDATVEWRAPALSSLRGELRPARKALPKRVEFALQPDKPFDKGCDRVSRTLEVSPEGSFAVHDLPPVPGRLFFTAAGVAPITRAVRLEPGRELAVGPLVFVRGATLRGTVKTRSGAPAAGLGVSVRDLNNDWVRGTTDAKGAFVLDNLVPGRVEVRAFDPTTFETLAETEQRLVDGQTASVNLVLTR